MAFPRLPRRRWLALAGASTTAIAAAVGLAWRGGRGAAGAGGTRGRLVVAAPADEYVTEPLRSRLSMYPLNVWAAEPLVRLAPDYRVEPCLAERWQRVGDNTWRFHLRRGVRFHDGRAFGSADVVWSLARAARGEGGTGFLSAESARAVDAHTVDVTPLRANLRLPEQLVHPTYSIVADGSEPAAGVVGTGPFRVTRYLRAQEIAVERFDGYWGAAAKPREIVFRFLPDATTRLLALFAGEVDLVVDVPREQASALAGRAGVRLARSPGGQNLIAFLNRGRADAPFADADVRRAFALGIDRARLVRDVLRGEALPVQNMAPPAVLGAAATRVRGLPYDPAGAATLLERGGYVRGADGMRHRQGRPLRLTLLGRHDLVGGVAEFVQAEMRALGVEAQVALLPDIASYQVRLRAGEFDATLELPNQNDANPAFLPALRLYSQAGSRTVRWFPTGAAFDTAIERALAAADPALAREHAAEAIHLAVDDEVSVVPLAGIARLFALRSTLGGFVAHPSFTSQTWHEIEVAA